MYFRNSYISFSAPVKKTRIQCNGIYNRMEKYKCGSESRISYRWSPHSCIIKSLFMSHPVYIIQIIHKMSELYCDWSLNVSYKRLY